MPLSRLADLLASRLPLPPCSLLSAWSVWVDPEGLSPAFAAPASEASRGLRSERCRGSAEPLPDPDCLAEIAATRSPLRIPLAPLMPMEEASCFNSGRSMPDRPLPDLVEFDVEVSVTWCPS